MSQTFERPTTAGAQKNECAMKDGAVCRDPVSPTAEAEGTYAARGSSDGRKGFMVSQLVQMSSTPEGWVLSLLLPQKCRPQNVFLLRFLLFQ